MALSTNGGYPANRQAASVHLGGSLVLAVPAHAVLVGLHGNVHFAHVLCLLCCYALDDAAIERDSYFTFASDVLAKRVRDSYNYM